MQSNVCLCNAHDWDRLLKYTLCSRDYCAAVLNHLQACDLRHYSLFSLMSSKLTLFTLFLIFETLFIIFVKFRHYLYKLDIICLNWFKIGTKWVNWLKIGSNGQKWVKMGQICSFVENHVMSRLRAFFDIIF